MKIKGVERIGEECINNQGSKMKIIEYNDSTNIIVEFQDEYKININCTYQQFKDGRIKNPYNRSIYGVGFIGKGDYYSSIKNKITEQYKTWYSMMSRAYGKKYQEKYPTYRSVVVCSEWLNFQVFAKWYDNNYYEIDNIRMTLDKDILIKGNKIYSPETCIFVSNNINTLFTKCNSTRGVYPIGVNYIKSTNKYIAHCNNQFTKKLKHLGTFPTLKLAFNSYKKYKENHIKEVADYYRDQIPNKLYNAMYKYEVEITD